LLDASNFIATIEKRQGYKIACIEEIAYRQGYIDKKKALHLAEKFSKSGYGDYIKMIVEED
jgi:glucose-1-phosphate thymidylyltransferase